MKRLSLLSLLIFMGMTPLLAQIGGAWKGTLDVQGTQLEMIFHIEDKSGALSATLDIPLQKAMGLPLDKVSFNDPNV